MVIFANLALRPLSRLLDRQPIRTTELSRSFAVEIICRASAEAHVRALLLQGFAGASLHLSSLESTNNEDTDRVEIASEVHGESIKASVLEQIVSLLSLEPSVTELLPVLWTAG